MKRIILTALFIMMTVSVLQAQVPSTCITGSWSITSQPPVTCVPSATGLFAKRLPWAGYGGPAASGHEHLAANSDNIAYNTLTNNGTAASSDWAATGFVTPGSEDPATAVYYGRSTDPIYLVYDRNHTSLGYWHVPNRAIAPQNSAENFVVIWDQTKSTNNTLKTYNQGAAFPACTATTEATACATSDIYYTQVSAWDQAQDWGQINSAGDSLHNTGNTGHIRPQEIIAGTINHALYLNTHCLNDTDDSHGIPGYVFPANQVSAQGCTAHSTDAGNASYRPFQGALFFLDYTDAQIDAMSLPAWQKPFITAMAHYGGYIGDTTDDSAVRGVAPSREESGEAYAQAGTTNPIYAFLDAQGISYTTYGASPHSARGYTLSLFDGIPAVVGPYCPSSTCGIERHLHVAAECVALGMAGQAGGCGSTPALQITSQPAAGGGSVLVTQPVLQLKNDASNESKSGVSVIADLVRVTGAGSLTGTATVSTNSSGVATFSGLSVSSGGVYRLHFYATGYVDVLSNEFTLPTAAQTGIFTGAVIR